MEIGRREFIRRTTAGAALCAVLGPRAAATAAEAVRGAKFRLGVCDWSLGKEGSPEAFAIAKGFGIEGVEVSLGVGADKLPLSEPDRRGKFLAAAKAAGLAIPSTCLEILHRDGLKQSAKGPKWVEEAIGPTKDLGAKVILLPMFGGNAINKREEQKAVAERLKPIAALAEKAGVVLGLENTCSAEDNAWIIDQVGSKAVQVYYDVGNSSPTYDIYKEIVWLGKDRLCQIHLKDGNGPLGTGKIDFTRLMECILKSRFEGWLFLETSPKTMKADASFVKGIIPGKA